MWSCCGRNYATHCGCRGSDSGRITCRFDAVAVIEHGFSQDKSAMYTIERIVWRFVELGMLDNSPPELVVG